MFNELGRKIPSQKCRVFDGAKRNFYKITRDIKTSDIYSYLNKSSDIGMIDRKFDSEVIYQEVDALYRDIKYNEFLQNILNGTCIPFSLYMPDLDTDIGQQIVDFFLPHLEASFDKSFASRRFKATLQGNIGLAGNITCVSGSGYTDFLSQIKRRRVTGLYFPTAFQEYDIASQRAQLPYFSSIKNMKFCISGHVETFYAAIMENELLNDCDYYSPILCMSGIEHSDPRMVAVLKSYGPHLEFWLLSQMLAPEVTQVSEQWSGGLTVYR